MHLNNGMIEIMTFKILREKGLHILKGKSDESFRWNLNLNMFTFGTLPTIFKGRTLIGKESLII